MTQKAYAEAHEALDRAAAAYRLAMDRYTHGLITRAELQTEARLHLDHLQACIDGAFTSALDPRDDARRLIDATAHELERLAAAAEADRAIPDDLARGLRDLRSWVAARSSDAEAIRILSATATAWESRRPQLASPRRRAAAVDSLELGIEHRLNGPFLTGMVKLGMRAFGPRLAHSLAVRYLDRHYGDPSYWRLVTVALDQLAAWAAATEPTDVPEVYAQRAIPVLIEIAGHPELTTWAVIPVPLHRATSADLSELGTILADRGAVMPDDWISDDDQLGTLSVEVAYLWALDGVVTRCPGLGGPH